MVKGQSLEIKDLQQEIKSLQIQIKTVAQQTESQLQKIMNVQEEFQTLLINRGICFF